MRAFKKLIGLLFFLGGIYFLGQNIVFTTRYSPYWTRDISGVVSVLSTVGGAVALIYGAKDIRLFGWFLVGFGILMAFLSGGIIVRPTSLWTLFLCFASFSLGFQLMKSGRFRF